MSHRKFLSDHNLKGKSALVTGSTSGIGLGLARALAEEGMNITLNGFGEAVAIEKLKNEIATAANVVVRHSAANMKSASEIQQMIEEHVEAFGSLDVLINNAGIQFVSPIDDFPEEKWNDIIAINLSSSFHTIRLAVPLMKKQRWGRIVNIASAHGLVASPFKSAYVAAKHGILGLTKSVALELAEFDITVNAICPGYVRTPLVENQIDQQAASHNMPRDQVIRDVILAAQPKKEFVEVEHLAAMAVFLCGPAGRAVTGTSLSMDGGWTAR